MADDKRTNGTGEDLKKTVEYIGGIFKGFKAPEDITVSEWADRYRILSPENSAEAGRWKTRRTPYTEEIMNAFCDPKVKELVVVASSQVGKALAIDTPIPTIDGWKTMGEIEPGDILFGEDGKPCRVTFATNIMLNHDCYKVTFSDHSTIVADAEHYWYVQSDTPLAYPNGTNKKAVYDGILATEQLVKDYKYSNKDGKVRNRYAVPVTMPLECPERDLPIKPYTLGLWLGDGHSYSSMITQDKRDVRETASYIKADGYHVEIRESKDKTCEIKIDTLRLRKRRGICKRGHNFNILGLTKAGYCAECARQESKHYQYGFVVDPVTDYLFSERLTALGVMANKHIPDIYKRASRKQRTELLQGLMDSDGTIGKNGRCEITLKSKRLIKDVAELLVSLGFKAEIKARVSTCKYKGKLIAVRTYRISFMAYKEDVPVFRLKRKAQRLKSKNDGYRRVTETKRRRIIGIEKVDSVPVKCIQVDNESHLYLAGRDMVPTHNTETLLNMVGYMIDQDPGPALYVVPTKDFAEDFSKRRLAPMIRDTKAISDKVSDAKSRNSNNTITKKHYPGGMMSIIGSNSPTDLAGTPARYIFADEIDRWTRSAGSEGDPWRLLRARTTTFYNSKMVAVSTPTIRNASKIEDLFESGTKEYWCVQCPHCGEYSFITFDTIRFKHHTIGTGSKRQFIVDETSWACPICGCSSTENEMKRQPMKWIAESPEAIDNGCRSFWINGFYSPWKPWKEIIVEFLDAGKDPEKLQTVFNTLFGQLWDVRGDLETEDEIASRAEVYDAELPDGVLCLTMGVDTQDNRLEYEVVGYGLFEENWGIEKGIIDGKPSDPEVWEKLDGIIDRSWYYKNGRALKISLTFVDSGGHYTQEVYYNCALRQGKRVFPIKGANRADTPYTSPPKKVEFNTAAGKSGKTWMYMIGVDAGKEHIMSGLRVKEPGARMSHFPSNLGKGYDSLYYSGLLSEVMTLDSKGAWKWEKIPGHERNEALDCRNYANAAFKVLHPNLDALKQQLNTQTAKKAEIKPRRTTKRRSSVYEDW